MKKRMLVVAVALSGLLLGAYAAERGTNSASRAHGRNGQGEGQGHRPPEMPLMKALDTNGDGVLDAKEIANASASLKKLDKNGDGKLTRDEIMPNRPDRGGRGGQGGPGGDNGNMPPPPGE